MSNYRLLVGKWCHIAILTTTVATEVHAQQQQPGTNLATQAPVSTTTSQPGGIVPGPTEQGVDSSLAPEPVIDAESSTKALPNRPLLITGALLFGASYGASAIVAATSNRTADDKLYYPVAGPWMDLNRRNCDVEACSNKTLDRVLLIGDGIVQGVGALGVLLSLVVPEKTTHHWYLIGNEKLMVFPQLGHSMLGLGATSSF